MLNASATLCLAVALAATLDAEPVSIELGGPRRARAVLMADDDAYRIQVRMTAVRSFDRPMNDQLNRTKARELALMALAKHLAGNQKAVTLRVRGEQVQDAREESQVFRLTLRVPREGVQVGSAEKRRADNDASDKMRPAVAITFNSALFTRKKDYSDTAREIVAIALHDLHGAQEIARKDPDARASLAQKIEEIRERAAKNLAKLRGEIEADLLLLSMEQEELRTELAERDQSLFKEFEGAALLSRPNGSEDPSR